MYEKKLTERLKKNLQVNNSKEPFHLYNENRSDVTKENAIRKALLLEETRNEHLNKYIKNSRPEVENYYKKYVE